MKRGISHSPKAAAGSIVHKASTMTNTRRASQATLSKEQLAMLRQRLRDHDAGTFAQAYQAWGLPWDGLVSEWDFLRVVRELLGVGDELLDDLGVHAAWSTLE